VGFDAASDEEARCRNAANRRWIERAVEASRGPDTRALAIAMQANPWFTRKRVFDELLDTIQRAGRALGKPVLLIHGDTHNYQVDQPFTDATGAAIANITRVETYGSPIVGWVKVSVTPGDPWLFRFTPYIQAIVP